MSIKDKKKKSFVNKLWSTDGDVSMKRFVSLVGFTLMAIAFTINIFKEVKLKEFIWDGMLWVVLGGLGLTVAEKFNYKNKTNVTKDDETVTATDTTVINNQNADDAKKVEDAKKADDVLNED